MKSNKILLLFLSFLLLGCNSAEKQYEAADQADWKLSMQSYTFHRFTVVESLEKCKELGVNYIEIYPGHRMGSGFGDALFGYDLSVDQQNQLKTLAKSNDVTIVSSGVWTAARDDWEKVFAFAQKMGLEFISAEPARPDWDVVEQLAQQYGVKVACHNHPNENSYWKPEILLQAIADRSDLLGACADVGHFKRMGVEPIVALQKLQGRIVSLHFKDIEPQPDNNSFEDVVWGTGVLNVEGMLEELKSQSFKGYFTIEYEANWENNLPEIKRSIEYYTTVADNLFSESE